MDRFIFEKKILNNQRPRVDRFVAPRDSFPELRRRTLLGDSCGRQDDDIWCSKYIKRQKYAKYLDESFGLEPLKLHGHNSVLTNEHYVQPWPCIPRKRKFLSSADSILDLPTYRSASFPELLDWNNENILVAALGRTYHKWSWRTQSLASNGLTQSEIQCCKFDPRGKLLVLGTVMFIEIHDNTSNKMIHSTTCQCDRTDDAICTITAIDWSPTGNSFVSGCLLGVITSFDRNGWQISSRKLGRKPIIIVRVSPNARYLAAVPVNSKVVLVLTWPTLEPYLTLDSEWTLKSIAWHPWRSALLGVGGILKDRSHSVRIGLWDTPTSKTREAWVGREHSNLDAMLFSHKTGELVLSVCSTDSTTTNSQSRLVVMSDPDTVVDQWGDGKNGMDRVRTMVFSPDGTKLATATAGEDLFIWNFLPEDIIKKKENTFRRHYSLPIFLDQTTQGFSLR